ncbi:MAG: AAA family ATPase [Bacteroidales bacterium]|nr:AAA family ATPase [Bacteroidales bacterium]
MKKLSIPSNEQSIEVESQHCFVIIGANGSGKSRLGAWIEKKNINDVHRISAQREISIPDYVQMKSSEQASNELFYGNEKNQNKIFRWGQEEYTNKLTADFNSVLSLIFAEKSRQDADFVIQCKQKEHEGIPHDNVPVMVIDKILAIWDSVFPHRRIIFSDAKVVASVDGNVDYNGKEMSDGERVAIYLIGQCLVARSGITLIIDEPEIHLHKSIMNKLWNKIEEYCEDKTIVYITHDLDFASSRKDSTKIWVKSYNDNNWELTVLEDNEDIPDNLMFEVLGSRKNVLFVEGEKSSYDFQIYSHVYSDYYIIPRKNCRAVIESTKAFNNIKQIHNLDIKGIIDRDYMTDAEVQTYKEQNIYSLEVAEIENIYCVNGLLKVVAEHLALPEKIIQDVKDFLFDEFKKELDNQLASMCEREIKHKLNCYSKSGNTKELLKSNLQSLVSSINIDEIYNFNKSRLDIKIDDHDYDYDQLLKVYNRKSLHKKISHFFGLRSGEYADLVLRLLKTDKKSEIIEEVKKFTPQI